jgi:hypothetical protein
VFHVPVNIIPMNAEDSPPIPPDLRHLVSPEVAALIEARLAVKVEIRNNDPDELKRYLAVFVEALLSSALYPDIDEH